MANVSNVSLNVGRAASGLEYAEVSYDIEFTGMEQELNLSFSEWVILYERDDDLDRYVDAADYPIGITRFARGNTDDYIGQVHFGAIRPNGSASVSRSHRREWNFPNNEGGREEYRALVQVVPEINRGAAWSNEVSINLA